MTSPRAYLDHNATSPVRPEVAAAVVQALSEAQSILALVSTGMGLALVPAETRNACFDNVTFRPIAVAPAAAVELHAAWRPENRNPAIGPFRDLLHRVASRG